MLRTKSLMDSLNRVFDKLPGKVLVLRLRGFDGNSIILNDPEPVSNSRAWVMAVPEDELYHDIVSWKIENAFLYVYVNDVLKDTINLADHTIRSLIDYLDDPYIVEYADISLYSRSALILIDGEGKQNQTNGDHLYGYTSLLWSVLESSAYQLDDAQSAIADMLDQMSVQTADEYWLDTWGDWFSVPRLSAETDDEYRQRIIDEVLTVRSNNIALESLIERKAGIRPLIRDIAWDSGNILRANVLDDKSNTEGEVLGPAQWTDEVKEFMNSLGYLDPPFTWGNPANENYLWCAFAVIIPGVTAVDQLSDAQRTAIKDTIERNKAAGTLAIYFISSQGPIIANKDGDELNESGLYAGPHGAQFTQVTL